MFAASVSRNDTAICFANFIEDCQCEVKLKTTCSGSFNEGVLRCRNDNDNSEWTVCWLATARS